MNITFKGQIDHELLRQELEKFLGPGGSNWYLNGSTGSVTFVSSTMEEDPSEIIQLHIDNAIDRVRNNIWEKIKTKRDDIKTKGVLVAGKWFQTDADSRIQFLGLKDSARDAVTAGGELAEVVQVLGQNVVWKTFDNTYLPITGEIAYSIVQAIKELDAKTFGVAEQHRLAILASDIPESYDFSIGWPASYVA
jgi:hypothetical protein